MIHDSRLKEIVERCEDAAMESEIEFDDKVAEFRHDILRIAQDLDAENHRLRAFIQKCREATVAFSHMPIAIRKEAADIIHQETPHG